MKKSVNYHQQPQKARLIWTGPSHCNDVHFVVESLEVEYSSRSAAVERLKMDNILQIPHTGQENM